MHRDSVLRDSDEVVFEQRVAAFPDGLLGLPDFLSEHDDADLLMGEALGLLNLVDGLERVFPHDPPAAFGGAGQLRDPMSGVLTAEDPG